VKQSMPAHLVYWVRGLLNLEREYDPDEDVGRCPEPDCMLRLKHRGPHQYGKDDPLVRRMQEIGSKVKP